jgi:hypothetical protein
MNEINLPRGGTGSEVDITDDDLYLISYNDPNLGEVFFVLQGEKNSKNIYVDYSISKLTADELEEVDISKIVFPSDVDYVPWSGLYKSSILTSLVSQSASVTWPYYTSCDLKDNFIVVIPTSTYQYVYDFRKKTGTFTLVLRVDINYSLYGFRIIKIDDVRFAIIYFSNTNVLRILYYTGDPSVGYKNVSYNISVSNSTYLAYIKSRLNYSDNSGNIRNGNYWDFKVIDEKLHIFYFDNMNSSTNTRWGLNLIYDMETNTITVVGETTSIASYYGNNYVCLISPKKSKKYIIQASSSCFIVYKISDDSEFTMTSYGQYVFNSIDSNFTISFNRIADDVFVLSYYSKDYNSSNELVKINFDNNDNIAVAADKYLSYMYYGGFLLSCYSPSNGLWYNNRVLSNVSPDQTLSYSRIYTVKDDKLNQAEGIYFLGSSTDRFARVVDSIGDTTITFYKNTGYYNITSKTKVLKKKEE